MTVPCQPGNCRELIVDLINNSIFVGGATAVTLKGRITILAIMLGLSWQDLDDGVQRRLWSTWITNSSLFLVPGRSNKTMPCQPGKSSGLFLVTGRSSMTFAVPTECS